MKASWTLLIIAAMACATAPAFAGGLEQAPMHITDRGIMTIAPGTEEADTDPLEPCWIETRTINSCCDVNFLRYYWEDQERLCCQYTGCRAWQVIAFDCTNYPCPY